MACSDEAVICVYDYTNSEKIATLSGHTDYIRYLTVHPTMSYVISGSDDMTIRLWDWDKKWKEVSCYDEHDHYVMQICINPKENNSFASASLDGKIKIWPIGPNLSNSHYSLVGHKAGVNTVDYCHF